MALSQNAEIQEEPTTRRFNRFDVAYNHSDHHYANINRTYSNGVDPFTNASSRVHKKIAKEWNILEKNLPNSIYVRVYERRIDLLRAVILGPAGTPYQDGLFFFDFAFPPDYPNRPPHVHYRSFGLRVNPNLYSNGYVCLSLLNTWKGMKNEKWNPAESTVLQVLVSIQGLVLNEKPYFNEPGTAKFSGWERRSAKYNENVLKLSCKTMLYLLRTPPKNFENFIIMHFRERAHNILTIVNAYMNGRAQVGFYGSDGSSLVSLSRKFKAAMEPLFDKLSAAFEKIGASLGHFVEQEGKKNETASFKAAKVHKKAEEKQKKKETASSKLKVAKKLEFDIKKVFGKIKNILGLKKGGESNVKDIEVKA